MNVLAVRSSFSKWRKLPESGPWTERRTHTTCLTTRIERHLSPWRRELLSVTGNQAERGPEVGDKETGFQRTR